MKKSLSSERRTCGSAGDGFFCACSEHGQGNYLAEMLTPKDCQQEEESWSKMELNPLDCWAAGPCWVLVEHVDFPSCLQSEEKSGHFQPGVQACS